MVSQLDLSGNKLCGLDSCGRGIYSAEGITAIANALRVNGGLTSIDLSNNQLCGVWTDYRGQHGTYTAEGITAIADAMRVNGGLTRVDVRHNNIVGGGAAQLAAAVLGNLKIEMFNKIPIKEMRADSLSELDLSGKGVGVPGALVLAHLLPVTGALTVANLLRNELNAESANMLVQVAKQKGISLCGIQRDQTTADFRGKGLKPPDAILLASDLSQAIVTGGLTRVDVRLKNIAGDGAAQLAAAVLGNHKIEMFNEIPIKEMRANSITELDLKRKYVGVEGGMVVAGLILVMGGLTALDLSNNYLKDEGVSAVCEAIQSNKKTKLSSLNFKDNGIGPVGAKSVEAMVAVTGSLTLVRAP